MSNQPSGAWMNNFSKFVAIFNDPKLLKKMAAAAQANNEAAARLEKAAGGKRKLDKADKILSDANEKLASAQDEAIHVVTEAEITAGKVRETAEREVRERAKQLTISEETFNTTSAERTADQDEREQSLNERKDAADARDESLKLLSDKLQEEAAALAVREEQCAAIERRAEQFLAG